MEGAESVLEAIYEEEDETLDLDDVEMLDAETLAEGDRSPARQTEPPTGGADGGHAAADLGSRSKNQKRRANKKKNKWKKKNGSSSNITDINRFVIDTCRQLKEKKSYLIWNAVGCLGVSAINDLVKEVDTIQNCGGQMTADGKRFRTGGGILWNIMKIREPKAYKEIMSKGKEFEKQFMQPKKEVGLLETNFANGKKPGEVIEQRLETSDSTRDDVSTLEGKEVMTGQGLQSSDSTAGRVSALQRIRVPVSYDDLFEDGEIQEPTCSKDGLFEEGEILEST